MRKFIQHLVFLVLLAGGAQAADLRAVPQNTPTAILEFVSGVPLDADSNGVSHQSAIALSALTLGQMRGLGLDDGRFSLNRVELLGTEPIPSGQVIVGVAVYEEPSGRRIHRMMRIETITTASASVVDRIDAFWTSPSLPGVRVIFVDRAAFNPPRADTLRGSLNLYQEIVAHQVDAGEFDPSRHDLLFLLIDSVASDAIFDATRLPLSSRQSWSETELERLDETSWPVLRVSGSRLDAQTLRLFYTPGQDQPSTARQRRMVAEVDFGILVYAGRSGIK